MPCAVAIGGLDPSGGAGLPADTRAMRAFGVHCCQVATAVIAQNTTGVAEVEAVSPHMLAAQLDNLLADITPRAVKIGMLPNAAAVRCVLQRLRQLDGVLIVIDTVFAPSQGPRFADPATVTAIADNLLPVAELATPNSLEAATLCGEEIHDLDAAARAARCIQRRYGARHVLVKGGHLSGDGGDAVDVLFDGEQVIELRAPWVAGTEVRGTGCLLASAIAAQLAHGVPLVEATRRAKEWLTVQIQQAQPIGRGRRVAT